MRKVAVDLNTPINYNFMFTIIPRSWFVNTSDMTWKCCLHALCKHRRIRQEEGFYDFTIKKDYVWSWGGAFLCSKVRLNKSIKRLWRWKIREAFRLTDWSLNTTFHEGTLWGEDGLCNQGFCFINLTLIAIMYLGEKEACTLLLTFFSK